LNGVPDEIAAIVTADDDEEQGAKLLPPLASNPLSPLMQIKVEAVP